MRSLFLRKGEPVTLDNAFSDGFSGKCSNKILEEVRMQKSIEIHQMEKTAEGFKNETTRQLTQKVLERLKDLEACI